MKIINSTLFRFKASFAAVVPGVLTACAITYDQFPVDVVKRSSVSDLFYKSANRPIGCTQIKQIQINTF